MQLIQVGDLKGQYHEIFHLWSFTSSKLIKAPWSTSENIFCCQGTFKETKSN